MPYLLHAHSIPIPYKNQCQNETPKTSKISSKILKKYLPNPPKMAPKSLPGTLLGAYLQKVLILHQFFVPMEVQWEPRETSKITKNHQNSKKEDPKKAPKISTSKNIENKWFWDSPGPAGSCWDSSESVVFTNSPNHEKVIKIDPKSTHLGAPGDTKITKKAKTWPPGKHLKK